MKKTTKQLCSRLSISTSLLYRDMEVISDANIVHDISVSTLIEVSST